MDIKTKIENETIFKRRAGTIRLLNKEGIFTIEDFINYDIEQLVQTEKARKQYRAYQNILRYKYLDEPLVNDVLLEKEYDLYYPRGLHVDAQVLGFQDLHISLYDYDKKYNNPTKMIEIINNTPDTYTYDAEITKFYKEYYKAKKKKEKLNNAGKKYLDKLKKDLTILIEKRNKLDSKISDLLEQINIIEEGKINNGK